MSRFEVCLDIIGGDRTCLEVEARDEHTAGRMARTKAWATGHVAWPTEANVVRVRRLEE